MEGWTTAELTEQGRQLRKTTPRSALGTDLDLDRDPISLLDAQNAARVQELVPVRWGRMAQSAFAFYRGTAALMAHDLATTPVSGLRVQACGDAHLSNFGLFASPERTLVFDLNDFDETTLAPWEWDVERLVASLAVAARSGGFGADGEWAVAHAAASAYRTWVAKAASASALTVYHKVVTEDLLRSHSAVGETHRGARDQEIERAARKARGRTSERSLDQLSTSQAGGQLRIVEQAPLIVRPAQLPGDVMEIPRRYRSSLSPDIDVLLRRFRPVDLARKVVGVGSVGTRAFILLCVDSGGNPLFLQAKEASRSVLEAYAGPCGYDHMGQRVVAGQKIMQAVSDPLLGWTDSDGRQYYVRHFRDMKGGFEIERLSASLLGDYARLCGAVLARAHVQSCEPAMLAGYLGKGKSFPNAMARYAVDYADQNDRDYQALLDAIADGRIVADQQS